MNRKRTHTRAGPAGSGRLRCRLCCGRRRFDKSLFSFPCLFFRYLERQDGELGEGIPNQQLPLLIGPAAAINDGDALGRGRDAFVPGMGPRLGGEVVALARSVLREACMAWPWSECLGDENLQLEAGGGVSRFVI